jgi:Mitochondrial ribosomal protein S23.
MFAVLTHFLFILRRFHKEHTSLPPVNLSDQQTQTQSQKFIATYYKLKEDGIPKENLYATVHDVVNAAGTCKGISGNVASSFQEAWRDTNVNIKDIFKD